MTAHQFDQPVSIFVGLGFPHEVETVQDAYNLLLESKGTSNLECEGALDICRKALNGEKSPQDAREAFESFARSKGMLSEDALDRAASNLAREWGRLSA